jgi:hypothetical protein
MDETSSSKKNPTFSKRGLEAEDYLKLIYLSSLKKKIKKKEVICF